MAYVDKYQCMTHVYVSKVADSRAKTHVVAERDDGHNSSTHL